MHLSTNIQKIRKLTGLTQSEFAEYIAEDRVSLAMQKSYEGGKAEPDILYMERLSEISGFDTKALVGLPLTEHQLRIKVKKVEKVSREMNTEMREPSEPYGSTKPTYSDRYIKLLEETVKEKKDQLKELQARLDELAGRQADFLAKVEGSIERYEHLVQTQLQNAHQGSDSSPTVLQQTYRTSGSRQKGNTQHKDQQKPYKKED